MFSIINPSKRFITIGLFCLTRRRSHALRPLTMVENRSYVRTQNLLPQNIFSGSIISYSPIHVRHKSKSRIKQFNKYKNNDYDSDESDSDDDIKDELNDDELKGPGIEVKTITTPSLRVDLILKSGFGYKRRKIENLFYEKQFRINGNLVLKKSRNVAKGDEIDIIKDVSPDNPNLLIVKRIEVLDIKVDKEIEKFLVKIRKSNSLIIENYLSYKSEKTSL